MTLAAGTKLGVYEIRSLLGAGGMGEVYRARDTRLERDVAIKVLPAARASDPDRVRRFEQEARAVAALNHPHICQIYDVGPDYLVLEYVDGEPPSGPLKAEDALRLALQIAGALEVAHRRGILHRDLKPANILVTAEGTAKLLDFGLAKLVDADSDVTGTREGAVVGTAAYMSPEQADGHAVDARSDVFSFGVVLYELFSGQRAFAGATLVQVLNAVLRQEPAAMSAPAALESAVRRCLQKKPADRFQSMTEVRLALEDAARALGSARVMDAQPSIAVLPFVDMSPGRDHEWFSDGLADEIIGALSRVPGLKVIARTSAFAFKGKQEDVRRIAETLGVAHVLEGSVRKAGSRIRVTAQLIAAADGSHLWSERYDRELADIFAIQDEIAGAIAAALPNRLAPKAAARRRHSPSVSAHEAFLRGRHHLIRFTPESWGQAQPQLERAIALDPDYAEAHSELGTAYLLTATNGIRRLPEVAPLIRAEAQTALALDAGETSPHYLLASVAAAHDYEWRLAGEGFRTALASASDLPYTHWAYASLYLNPLGRFQESIAEMEREVERDPLNVPWRGILSSHLISAELYDRAIENAQEALEIDERHWLPNYVLGLAYALTGRFREAIAVAEKGHEALPSNSMPIGVLAGALANVGEKVRAEELIRQMGDTPFPIWGRVEYHLLCAEIDAAADWYEKMIDVRDPFAVVFAASPIGRRLRESGRWPKLAKMMNLPAAPRNA